MRRRGEFDTTTLSKSDWAPGVFLFFAILGAGLVATSKILGLPTLAVIFIPIAILLLYGFSSWKLARMDIRLDQLGDNLYYLGFLLTLVSLSVTLYQYSSTSNEDFIVSNFGVALAATIAGIAGRAFLSQMRKDTTASEKEMQASLSEASLKLRSQVFSAVEGFSSLHRQMAQVTQESVSSIAQSHRDLAAGLSAIVEEHSNTLNTQIENSSKSINERSSRLIDEIDAMSRSLNNAVASEQKALENSAANARKVLASFEDVKVDTSSLDAMEEALREFASGLNQKLSAVAQSAARDVEVIGTASKRFGDSINTLEMHVNSSSQKLSHHLNEMGSHTLKVQRAIGTLSERASIDIDKISDTSSSFAMSLKVMEQALLEKSEQLHLQLKDLRKERELIEALSATPKPEEKSETTPEVVPEGMVESDDRTESDSALPGTDRFEIPPILTAPRNNYNR